jgi:hypothetical protein
MMALAWPLVTLAIALIFRQDLAHALGRIGRLKYHDLEVTFQEELHQAEDLVRKLPPPSMPIKPNDSIVLELSPGHEQPFVRPLTAFDSHARDRQSLLRTAERSPRLAIDLAWNRVGQAIGRGGRPRFNEAETRLVELLKTLRERALRLDRDSPSTDEARRFVELACQLTSRIESQG